MIKRILDIYDFLNDLWEPAIKRAKQEVKDMQALIKKEGNNFKLEAWDWWYYAEKVKREKYALDESMLRPYFKMENVRKGAFDVANKLFGIKFTARKDIQVYHPDVEVFEVFDKDGSHLGIFYSDYYPRDGKRSGAWSSSYRSQSNIDGNFKTPINFNVGNFTKPTADKPSLLSLDEVETLFHELGHHKATLLHSVDKFEHEAFAERYMLAYKKHWRKKKGPSKAVILMAKFFVIIVKYAAIGIFILLKKRSRFADLAYRRLTGKISQQQHNKELFELLEIQIDENGKKKWKHPLSKKKYRRRFNIPGRN